VHFSFQHHNSDMSMSEFISIPNGDMTYLFINSPVKGHDQIII